MSDILTSKQDANQVLRLAYDDAAKALRTTGGGSGSGVVTQPDGSLLHVTVDESALPTGAASEAKQDDQITLLSSVATTSGETADNTLAAASLLSDIKTNTTGSATAALQTAGNSSLSTIATNTTGVATAAGVTAFSSKTASSMVTVPYDNLAITYVGATDDINTVTYKSGATTVATLTMSYDGQGRLSGVVKS